MRVLSRLALTWVITLAFAAGLSVCRSDAQTLSAKGSERVVRERIATIFQETLRRGQTQVNGDDGSLVTAQTFVPPTTEDVDEIRRYGEEAIPILSDYLSLGYGFQKHLAMRFLGAIGGESIIAPLARVALADPSSSFRTTALLWLSVARWDLAAPIFKQAAESDISAEVREQAKAILAQH